MSDEPRDSVKAPQYALVAYIRGPVGKFVEELRGELYPEHAHLAAHVTVLPPRELCGTEEAAIAEFNDAAARVAAFYVELGDVESFAPTTPTVFIRVARGAHRFRDVHVATNTGTLQRDEQWPYMPHLTVVKMPDLYYCEKALLTARQRWAEYTGDRRAEINELVFVREVREGRWTDLARFRLRPPTIPDRQR